MFFRKAVYVAGKNHIARNCRNHDALGKRTVQMTQFGEYRFLQVAVMRHGAVHMAMKIVGQRMLVDSPISRHQVMVL
ncbi:hypothetical protein [Dyella sp. S184]|uniref:hypothetical protein n=1 Tax=Dyella sp. S184 TaxID=1641862 RepID=UPI0020B16023|nr:hypothetical protein [Dyella sp. S184]